jgi:hypothetical protein
VEIIVVIWVIGFLVVGWGLFLGKKEREEAKRDLGVVFTGGLTVAVVIFVMIPLLAFLLGG